MLQPQDTQSVVPIQPGMGQPQPNSITNEGINRWISQVQRVYKGDQQDALADSCKSMATNAQLLCMGNLHLDTMGFGKQCYLECSM